MYITKLALKKIRFFQLTSPVYAVIFESIKDQRRISWTQAESTGINRNDAAKCAQLSE